MSPIAVVLSSESCSGALVCITHFGNVPPQINSYGVEQGGGAKGGLWEDAAHQRNRRSPRMKYCRTGAGVSAPRRGSCHTHTPPERTRANFGSVTASLINTAFVLFAATLHMSTCNTRARKCRRAILQKRICLLLQQGGKHTVEFMPGGSTMV